MPKQPVTLLCSVVVIPGASVIPDTGIIVEIPTPWITANGKPLATVGSTCLMTNSVTRATYPLVIGPLGSSGVHVAGKALVRMFDVIPSPPGVLTILGPPATTSMIDSWPP